MLLGWNLLTSYCEERVDVYKYCNPKKTKNLQGKLIFSNKILRKEDWCYWVAMYVKEIIQGRLQWEPMLLQRVVLHWQAESFNIVSRYCSSLGKTRQSKQCGFSIHIFDNSKSKSMVRLVWAEKMVLCGLVFARKIARMILIQNMVWWVPWWLTWQLCLYICEKCEMSRLWRTHRNTDSGK